MPLSTKFHQKKRQKSGFRSKVRFYVFSKLVKTQQKPSELIGSRRNSSKIFQKLPSGLAKSRQVTKIRFSSPRNFKRSRSPSSRLYKKLFVKSRQNSLKAVENCQSPDRQQIFDFIFNFHQKLSQDGTARRHPKGLKGSSLKPQAVVTSNFMLQVSRSLE